MFFFWEKEGVIKGFKGFLKGFISQGFDLFYSILTK